MHPLGPPSWSPNVKVLLFDELLPSRDVFDSLDCPNRRLASACPISDGTASFPRASRRCLVLSNRAVTSISCTATYSTLNTLLISPQRLTFGGGFVSSVGKASVFGVQFHPEKSQLAGFQVLRNFLSI